MVVRARLVGRDVLAVLLTGYSTESFINQMFVRS